MNLKKLTRVFFLSTALAALSAAPAAAAPAAGDELDYSATNRYGGPVYRGAPALAVTAALVNAGGGATDFSIERALVAMLGAETVQAEVAKLSKHYGEDEVGRWVETFDFAVDSALRIATEKGVALPAPADLKGADLAAALVKAGTEREGTFWAGVLFDRALSNGIHMGVMDAITHKWDAKRDAVFHKITNQAMYDVGQALGLTDVKLARFH